MEHARIEAWLRRRAREALAGAGTTLEDALAAASTLARSLKPIFAVIDENRDPLLLEKARLGELEREAPSSGLRTLVTALTALAMSLETAVFLAIYFLDPGNVLVVVTGVLLSVGAWLCGHGLGNLVGFKDEEGHPVRSGGMNWGAVAAGVVVIAGAALVRTGGEEGAFFVVTFTTILAICIVLLEAIRTTLAAKFADRVLKMFFCEMWYATERHLESIGDGLWERVYETEVRRLKKGRDQALGKGEGQEEDRP